MFTNVEMFTVILACAKTLASFPAPPQLFKIGGGGGGPVPLLLTPVFIGPGFTVFTGNTAFTENTSCIHVR